MAGPTRRAIKEVANRTNLKPSTVENLLKEGWTYITELRTPDRWESPATQMREKSHESAFAKYIPRKTEPSYVTLVKSDAEHVLDRLAELIEQYGCATVMDLHEALGMTPEYLDSQWGWTQLTGAGVTKHELGWAIDLPKAQLIE